MRASTPQKFAVSQSEALQRLALVEERLRGIEGTASSSKEERGPQKWVLGLLLPSLIWLVGLLFSLLLTGASDDPNVALLFGVTVQCTALVSVSGLILVRLNEPSVSELREELNGVCGELRTRLSQPGTLLTPDLQTLRALETQAYHLDRLATRRLSKARELVAGLFCVFALVVAFLSIGGLADPTGFNSSAYAGLSSVAVACVSAAYGVVRRRVTKSDEPFDDIRSANANLGALMDIVRSGNAPQ